MIQYEIIECKSLVDENPDIKKEKVIHFSVVQQLISTYII